MSERKRIKLGDYAGICEDILDENVIKAIQKTWGTGTGQDEPKIVAIYKSVPEKPSLQSPQVEIITNPFSVCLVRNFISPDLIRNVVQQLSQVKLHEKNNDLYQFHQSEDIANLTHISAVQDIYSIIRGGLFKWVEKTFAPSGLKDQVAATFSCYADGDRLLCHDDQCEDRHIAFVLYLTEDWTPQDGGSLGLFNSDENGNPDRVVLSLTSAFNTLVLFQVTSKSFHQVAEITSKTKKRLSLNGWFHKDIVSEPIASSFAPYSLETHQPTSTEFQLEEYMFDKYLTFGNQIDIKTIFTANSEIQLDEFFQPSVFKKVMDEFNSTEVTWKMRGPPNIRHYEVVDSLRDSQGTLDSLSLCLQSRTWLRFLKNITGLDLVPAARSDLTAWQKGVAPSCKIELQRWLPGSYTLVHDRDPDFYTSALDVIVRIPVCEGDSKDSEGDAPEAGHVIYIDKDSKDEECLLHLGYKMNSLCLIFREPGTLRFTKYLHAEATPFYQIQCTYIPWAPPLDDPNLKHVDSEEEPESDAASEGEGDSVLWDYLGEGEDDDDDGDDSDQDGDDENGAENIPDATS